MERPASTIPFTPLAAAWTFPTSVDGLEDYESGEEPRTLLELRICAVAGEIRDRRGWWTKLPRDSIDTSWLEEVCCQQSGLWPESNADDAVYTNALGEVRWQASVYPGPARPASAYGTFSTDSIPTDVVSKLLAGVQKIRATTPRDVRPGSDGLVVDLLDPSMYAYEQGVTPVLGDASVKKAPAWSSFIGTGAARPEQKPGKMWRPRVAGHASIAWLPSELSVSDSGGTCAINSYINSLHPREYAEMYDAVAKAFLVAVPLFEEVLNFIGKGDAPWEMPLRFPNDAKWVSAGECGHVPHPPGEHPFRNDFEFSSEMYEGRTLIMPVVPTTFTPPTLPPRVISLKGKDLQVIVKLASIELTPEQPHYGGSTWHVEGMRNERIVATTCMCLEVENVIESRTEFRTAVRAPMRYEANGFLGPKRLLGLDEGGPLVQRRGASRMLPGRALAWPNTLQNRIRPFGLHEETRPGRLTLLYFLLVDPTLRVRSTATVPPQMKDWVAMESRAAMLYALPEEVRNVIASHGDGMSFEDACERREWLRRERGFPADKSGRQYSHQNARFERAFFDLDAEE